MYARFLFVFLAIVLLGVACGRQALDRELIDAAVRGDANGVRSLLDRGANIDAHARDDWTPLTVAAREGRLDVVKVLIKRGADVNETEGGGHTALFWAKKYQRLDVEQLLVAAGGHD